MRTTVDIPDLLYRRAKAKAALRGETFKRFLVKAVRNELKKAEPPEGKRLEGPLFVNRETLVYTGEELSEILQDDDRALLG